MNSTVPGSSKTAASWQKLVLFSAGLVGVMSVVAIAAAGASVLWFSTRPTPWDRSAITAQFERISVASGQPLVCSVQYTLENHTALDYELPTTSAPYKVIEGEALQTDATLKWESGAAIRPGQKSTARIQFPLIDYAAGTDIKQLNDFLRRRLARIEGFALLDTTRRFDIRFPKPTRTHVGAIDPAPDTPVRSRASR